MLTDCRLNHDPEIELELRTRFSAQLEELDQEEFRWEGSYETDHSQLLFPAVYTFGRFGREVHRVSPSMRVRWFHPIMRSQDGETMASPIGICTRFYTFFADGSAQRTSSQQGQSGFVEHANLHIDYVGTQSVSEAYMHHLAFCEMRIDEGKKPVVTKGTERYLQIQLDEDTTAELLMVVGMSWLLPLCCVGGIAMKLA